jgi:nucleotide-binding universal stress UspA family protein
VYQAVMVPLDGSEFGRHAIPWALAIAEPAGARVDLVHVLTPPYDMGVAEGDKLILAEAIDSQRTATEQRLEDLANRLHVGTGVRFSSAVVEGHTADALLRYADENAIDLIVMTTHGRSGLARAVLGSTSDQVVRRSRCPVLLARSHRHVAEEHEAAAVSDVLVPLDGTVTSEAILVHALEVCQLTGASCTLLHVVVPELLLTSVAVPVALADQRATIAEKQRADAYLASLADRFREGVVPVTIAALSHADVESGILEYCAAHPVSLIAMATRGTRGLERAVLGSTMDELLRKTHLPLLATSAHTNSKS